MKRDLDAPSLDRQINDYLLTASGHLAETRSSLDFRRAASYGAAAGSALVMMSQAEAAVVVNAGTTRPVTVVAPGGYGGTNYAPFDMNGDGINDFALFGGLGEGGWSAGINGTPGVANNYVAGDGDVQKLFSGNTVGPALNWQIAPDTFRNVFFNQGFGASNWGGVSGETGFAGVAMIIGGEGPYFGWIKLRLNAQGSLTATCWAYESTANAPITINGAVCTQAAVAPQPIPVIGLPALGLMGLAMGGMGLAGLRRRRQDQRATPEQ